ncbi:bifunctional DedA family/phosphatase PAP2 family protein [uncultured Jannaschia sp.]|uniref:bifunctional DedA family/phosphatase PAP2 family protein n=1 Tax=uncultured Jannaschia sp. TaxID=293347 RepID=UPI00260A111F|nr:bifunctional DedA family/phosphatase PAP2 family protein [uncultured Jannaschia sp.]
MLHLFDQILPSLQSMGVWTYWIVALFAMVEAIVFAGVLVPGAVAVIAGGALAQRGLIDFFDLAWFVGIGTILGGTVSFQLGRLAGRSLSGHSRATSSPQVARARDLLDRWGGFAMVPGRFLGPLPAFVPFAAAMAGMEFRRFMLWNALSAVPYALVLPAIGFFGGGLVGRLGAAAPRILAFALGALAVLAVLWFVVLRARRMLPHLADLIRAVRDGLTATPTWRGFVERHPVATRRVAARFDPSRFSGFTATALVAVFAYLLAAWLDSVFDFVGDPGVAQGDLRFANLLYAMRNDRLIAMFGWITAIGSSTVILVPALPVSAILLLLRRLGLLAGLWISILGNAAMVTLLKALFARPRSDLGYFVETLGSFPSGHAAGAVAAWGMLWFVAWRLRATGATVALLGAVTTAFLIGLSRIYLIEHYVSDVLNGYLVGGLWLVIGIAVAERLHGLGLPRVPVPAGRQRIAVTVLAVAAVCAIGIATTQKDALSPPPPVIASQAAKPAGTGTETLLGAPRGRVILHVEAADTAALVAAMRGAGWTEAARPGPVSLLRAAWSDWTGGSPPDPLIVPIFHASRPNDLAFAAPDEAGPDGRRLHARFWKVGAGSPGNATYVASAIREDPVGWLEDAARQRALAPSDPAVRTLMARLRAAGLDAGALAAR